MFTGSGGVVFGHEKAICHFCWWSKKTPSQGNHFFENDRYHSKNRIGKIIFEGIVFLEIIFWSGYSVRRLFHTLNDYRDIALPLRKPDNILPSSNRQKFSQVGIISQLVVSKVIRIPSQKRGLPVRCLLCSTERRKSRSWMPNTIRRR